MYPGSVLYQLLQWDYTVILRVVLLYFYTKSTSTNIGAVVYAVLHRNSQLATNNKQLRTDGNSSSANTSTGCTPSTHPVLRTTITSSLISSLMCAVVVSSDDTLASTNKSDREMMTFTTSRHNCHSQGSFTAFPRQIASCCLIPCKRVLPR